jgi:hypothetical protein
MVVLYKGRRGRTCDGSLKDVGYVGMDSMC